MAADQDGDHGQKQDRASEREQHAEIKTIKRVDIARHTGKNVARSPEAEPSSGTRRDPAEEPHPHVGECTKRRLMGDDPLEVAQHDPGDARAP